MPFTNGFKRYAGDSRAFTLCIDSRLSLPPTSSATVRGTAFEARRGRYESFHGVPGAGMDKNMANWRRKDGFGQLGGLGR